MAAVLFVSQKNGEKEDDGNEAEKVEDAGLQFPYEVADGKIQVNSLFQSSIGNPDFNDEIGEDIGSLEFVNISGEFIEKAYFTVCLEDGQELNFEAFNIPPDKTVWAFDKVNTEISVNVLCTEIYCEAEVLTDDQMMMEALSVEAELTEVKISNLTDNEISNLDVDFHCLFDGVYFGGKTYTYPIDNIQPKETISLQVEECYLGEAEAVRITQN